jgi:hypothetical protein
MRQGPQFGNAKFALTREVTREDVLHQAFQELSQNRRNNKKKIVCMKETTKVDKDLA